MSNNLEKVKKELIGLSIVLMSLIIILKICFYKENLPAIIKMAFSLFWLFILPGFCLMWYWHEKLDFLERFALSIALSASIIGISSYYIGLVGIHIKYHAFILPFFIIVIGIVMNRKRFFLKS